jgi:hypothetical protein
MTTIDKIIFLYHSCNLLGKFVSEGGGGGEDTIDVNLWGTEKLKESLGALVLDHRTIRVTFIAFSITSQLGTSVYI